MSNQSLDESDIDNLYETAEIAFFEGIIIGLWRILIKKTRNSLLS